MLLLNLILLIDVTFSTSLSTPAVSRNLRWSCLDNFEHTFHLSANALYLFDRATSFLGDRYPTTQLGPFFFILTVALAHQTSLRSQTIRMSYAISPPFGEAGSLFTPPGHC